MRVCLFEDCLVADLEPLCSTRPAFDLLCGCTSLADKQFRYFPSANRGALVRPLMAPLTQQRHPTLAVNELDWLRQEPIVLVNARWMPPAPDSLAPEMLGTPHLGLCDGDIAYAVLTPELLADCSPLTVDSCLAGWRETLPGRPVGGLLVQYLWELVERNGDEIALDAWLTEPERPRRTDNLPALIGPADRLVLDPSARIDPYVVVDTTGGPVVVDREAVVHSFTRLEGPCYIGPMTQLLGAKIRAGTSLGPQCRVGGEVEASIVLGHSNKYHDGFLGHAYLGEWVNLGAGTSNSDLRNDYGEVRVVVRGRAISTGRSKVGCFLGDHTKTGLGALVNTGTSVGAFCNLLPAGMLLPKYVPSFVSIWNGMVRENADLESLLSTAGKVMARRGRALDAIQERLYRKVYEETASARRQAIRDADVRRLRKSA